MYVPAVESPTLISSIMKDWNYIIKAASDKRQGAPITEIVAAMIRVLSKTAKCVDNECDVLKCDVKLNGKKGFNEAILEVFKKILESSKEKMKPDCNDCGYLTGDACAKYKSDCSASQEAAKDMIEKLLKSNSLKEWNEIYNAYAGKIVIIYATIDFLDESFAMYEIKRWPGSGNMYNDLKLEDVGIARYFLENFGVRPCVYDLTTDSKEGVLAMSYAVGNLISNASMLFLTKINSLNLKERNDDAGKVVEELRSISFEKVEEVKEVRWGISANLDVKKITFESLDKLVPKVELGDPPKPFKVNQGEPRFSLPKFEVKELKLSDSWKDLEVEVIDSWLIPGEIAKVVRKKLKEVM